MNTFTVEFKKAIELLKGNKAKIKEVAEHAGSTKWGIFFLVVPTVLSWLLNAMSYPSGLSVIFKPFVFWSTIVPVLSLVGMAFVMAFFAEKVYKSHFKPMELFRVLAYVGVILWLNIAVFLLVFIGFFGSSGLVGLISLVALFWMLWATHQFLVDLAKMSSDKAVITIIIGFFGYFIIGSILGSLFVGSYFSIVF